MPFNRKIKFAERYQGKAAQDIQDEIFRKMPIEKKIKLASNFFHFARELNPRALRYGTRRASEKNSGSS